MIKPPEKLIPYIDYYDGEIIPKNLPPDLKEEFEKFKKSVEDLEKENPLTDY